ncbi:hypothetical protein [Floridanema fluviatile]
MYYITISKNRTLKIRHFEQMKRQEAGERGIPLEEVVKQLDLDR